MIAFDLLQSVNDKVNRLITYKSDHLVHGKNKWQTATETLSRGTGDCEDYAILKAKFLVDSGCDISHMSIGVFLTEAGTYHAMLICKTQRHKGFLWWKKWVSCDVLLDNRTDAIYDFGETTDKLIFTARANRYIC